MPFLSLHLINDPLKELEYVGFQSCKKKLSFLKRFFNLSSFISFICMLISQWNHGKLLTMGWSNDEELVCVQDDGNIIIYDMFGEEKQTLSMGQEASHTKVIITK